MSTTFNFDPIPSAQDFGQTGTGYGSILQPFDPVIPGAGTPLMLSSQGTGNILGLDFTGGGAKPPPVTTGGGGRRILDQVTIDPMKARPLQLIPTDTQEFSPFEAKPLISGGDIGQNIPTPTGGGFGGRFMQGLGTPAAMGGIAKGVGGILQGLIGRRKRRREQRAAQAQRDQMMEQYGALDTSNLYANVQNKFANMENVYEDATVNRMQAEFEQDMFERSQANTMQNLRGAAGGSGIAGLAQAMSNQAMIARRQASATIGMQEKQNEMMKLREASRLQQMERVGEGQAEAQRLAGAETARSLDWRKTTTQLGMSQQRLAAANQAIAQSNAALYGGIGQLAGTALSAGIGAINPIA